MANITASAVGNPVVESLDQLTLIASVAVTALQPITINSSGQWVLADADAAGTATNVHIATKTVAAGQPLTGLRHGVLDGYDLTSLAFNAPVYVSADAGSLADAAGSNGGIIGRVVPALGAPLGGTANKLLKVNSPI
jgi:hypothetical protein